MENKAPSQNIQDVYLNTVRRDKAPVTVFLISGVKLIGKIKGFDKYSVILEANNQEQLIFKHAISTVTTAKTASAPPPPPPAMDDPSDPPPSIHSEYRSREGVAHQATPMTPSADLPAPQIVVGIPVSTRSHVSAPPPYLVPDGAEHEQVTRPPPYVDVMPPHESYIESAG